jgi:thioredoxin 1
MVAAVLKVLIGAAIGAGIGGLVGLLVRSSDKAWAFIKTPGRGAFFGAVVGVFFAFYFGGPFGWREAEQSQVVSLTADTFDEAVAGGTPAVVAFYSDGCPSCYRLAPNIERLADDYDGRVVVGRVNVGEETALAERHQIEVVPTLIFFGGGKRRDATTGRPSYGSLRKRVDKLLTEYPAAAPDSPTEPEPADETPPEEVSPTNPGSRDSASPEEPSAD